MAEEEAVALFYPRAWAGAEVVVVLFYPRAWAVVGVVVLASLHTRKILVDLSDIIHKRRVAGDHFGGEFAHVTKVL